MDLHYFRVKNRIKQVELSKETGFAQSKLSGLENGWRRLDRKTAVEIVRAYKTFGIDATEILKFVEK